MSADEFWKDDPQLFVSYRTFYLNKKQQEMEEIDYKCWLQGLYMHNGNGILVKYLVQVLSTMFGGKKSHSKLEEYPRKPFIEQQKEKDKQKEKELKYNKFQNSLVYAGTMKKRYLESIKNKNKLKGE